MHPAIVMSGVVHVCSWHREMNLVNQKNRIKHCTRLKKKKIILRDGVVIAR